MSVFGGLRVVQSYVWRHREARWLSPKRQRPRHLALPSGRRGFLVNRSVVKAVYLRSHHRIVINTSNWQGPVMHQTGLTFFGYSHHGLAVPTQPRDYFDVTPEAIMAAICVQIEITVNNRSNLFQNKNKFILTFT